MATPTAFNARSEAGEVAAAFASEITGRTIMITGVSPHGLSVAMLEALLPHKPALMIVTGRSPEKVSQVVQELPFAVNGVESRILELDLASLSSVRNAAATVNNYSEPSIDLLINNAGVMGIPERTLSADGVEMHLATNHLGHFLLVNLIKQKLIASKSGARVVNVASDGHCLSPIRFGDYNFEDETAVPEAEQPPKAICEKFGLPWGLGYAPSFAYGQSKTANILHARGLARRWAVHDVAAFAVMPGTIKTNLFRHLDPSVASHIHNVVPTAKTPSQGAATVLVALLDPELRASSGSYLENCTIASPAPWAADDDLASRLWELSERLSE